MVKLSILKKHLIFKCAIDAASILYCPAVQSTKKMERLLRQNLINTVRSRVRSDASLMHFREIKKVTFLE